jgi:M6 family metalloprotease-like protein
MKNKKYILMLTVLGGVILSGCQAANQSSVASVLHTSDTVTTITDTTSDNPVTSAVTSTTSKVTSAPVSSGYDPAEDPHKYDSVNADNPCVATIDNTSTNGYAAGRDFFDQTMKYNKDFEASTNGKHGQCYIPSTGTSKMLVVPILFPDTVMTEDEKDGMRSSLLKAFFGESTDTAWQSVRSYYYNSSFHQLYLEGTVAPCVNLPKTLAKYAGSMTGINGIVEKVYSYLFTGTNPVYKVSDFDSNGDGVIDSIYMVHASGIDSSTDLGWAFTTWHQNLGTADEALGTYSWSSRDFMLKGSGTFDKPDAHTYIHETGHLLGLNDYYNSYDSSKSIAGGVSMQDYNICDHESFSKYLWGWVSPQIVTDKNTETTIDITLKPYDTTGDCLVLASDFNGTSMDEYLMIEYWTPTGLNEADSKKTYDSTAGIDDKGIRIWHINKNIQLSHRGTYVDKTTGKTRETTYFDPNPVETVVTATDTSGKVPSRRMSILHG